MLPKAVNINGVWDVLPPGVHVSTMKEIEKRFAVNDIRKVLFKGFSRGVKALEKAGCRMVFLDGSFVTEKERPGDFDACWEPRGVVLAKLDPVFLDFSDRRRRQKQKYGGEFFPSSSKADGSRTFVDFFQINKLSGKQKGIIQIRLT